jgi:hypothetical protein
LLFSSYSPSSAHGARALAKSLFRVFRSLGQKSVMGASRIRTKRDVSPSI